MCPKREGIFNHIIQRADIFNDMANAYTEELGTYNNQQNKINFILFKIKHVLNISISKLVTETPAFISAIKSIQSPTASSRCLLKCQEF